MRLPATFLLLAATSLLGQNTQPSRDWQTWLNQGIQAFRSARYREAIDAFQKAADLNPTNVDAHLYLGTANLSSYIPSASSPDNLAYAARADAEFQRALQLDPNNRVAIASLASLSYQQAQGIPDQESKLRKLDQARDWYRKLAKVDPNNRETYYSLGVIAWAKCHQALTTARAQLGMRAEDPGPISNPLVREELKSKYEPIIYEGISSLEWALQLDPRYDDAMSYLNLLVRERADLRDTSEDYSRDVATAAEWVQKALDTKKQKAQNATAGSGQPPATPQRIRVGGNVQASNLIRRVDPVYPPLALQDRIQGTVHFTAIIGKDGRIVNLQLVSGHPALVIAASDAVRQWVYKPTLLNGEPVEVVTQVDVAFNLP
jgi:TonB family protein